MGGEKKSGMAGRVPRCTIEEAASAAKSFLHKRPKKTRGDRPLTSLPARCQQSAQRLFQQQQQPQQQHFRKLDAILRPLEALRWLEKRQAADADCCCSIDLRAKARSLRFRHADYGGWQRERQLILLEQPQMQQPVKASSETSRALVPQAPPLPLPPPLPAPQLELPLSPPPHLRPLLALRPVGRCKTARTCFIPLLRDSPGCYGNRGSGIMSLLSGIDSIESEGSSGGGGGGSGGGGGVGSGFRRPFPLPSSLTSGGEATR